MKFMHYTIALLCWLNAANVHADEVSVAVAANFLAPMKAIATEFEKDTRHHLLLSAASSGKFFVQIQNGAPFQVLLSADSEIPARLEQEGLAVAGSRFTYATGALVLWSVNPALVDSKGTVLSKNSFAKLAIADPKLAPYGKAAMETLTAMGRLDAVRGKVVSGENIGQTYQFVASGNADLGFVALSQVMKDGRIGSGSAWLVPESLHTPLRQDAVILTPGKHSEAARLFMNYLKGSKAREIMKSYGYRF